MKRRRFLSIAGVAGLVGAIASFKFATTTFEEAVENVIFRELGFLDLDKVGVRRFASDYSKPATSKYKLLLKSYSFMGINSQRSQKITHLIHAYLLSTDFFLNRMDEMRPVKYVGLYNPYLRPCANPFSSNYFSNTVAQIQ